MGSSENTEDRQPLSLAVFVSGRGSNLESILRSCQSGALEGLAEVALVVSSNKSASALKIAAAAGIDRIIYPEDIDLAGLCARLEEKQIVLIALAGYLRLIEPELVRRYPDRIVNIHPALIPKFSGKGMYGIRVHRAVIAAGESETGVTVHQVDEEYDTGAILAQERVPVLPGDTAETLGKRVLEVEHRLYPETIAKLIKKFISAQAD